MGQLVADNFLKAFTGFRFYLFLGNLTICLERRTEKTVKLHLETRMVVQRVYTSVK